MRYEPEHKTQTRERIVRNTANKLRAEGLNGPGVASVMKASGLTVGVMKDRAERWVEFMPGATAPERERNFFVIFSAMAGAVAIARLLTEPADRQKVLACVRDHLLHSF
ncbi:MAG TPA: hypothetical protein VIW23_03400 [Candidatus Acidoferrum sp.]|jgi:hypothetical protein